MNARIRGMQASDSRLPLSVPRLLTERAFRQGDVPAVRRFTHAFGVRTGIAPGRLEFGTARSSTWSELAGFEIDPDTTKQTWDETIRALPRMWTEERFS